jgi:predicted HicB family RNase H-like nuclease
VPLGSVDSDAKKTKTETVTFRLPSSLIDELRMDAELQGISLNNYAAKIFSNLYNGKDMNER